MGTFRSCLNRIIFPGKLKRERRFCTRIVSHQCHMVLKSGCYKKEPFVTCDNDFGISHHSSRFCTSNECDEDSGCTSKRLLEDFSGAGEVEGTDGERKKNNISGGTGAMVFLTTSVTSHFLSDKFLFSVLLTVVCSLFRLRGSTLCPLHFGLYVSFRWLSMSLSLLCSPFLPISLSLPTFYFSLSVCVCSLCLSFCVSLYVLPFPLVGLFLFVVSLSLPVFYSFSLSLPTFYFSLSVYFCSLCLSFSVCLKVKDNYHYCE